MGGRKQKMRKPKPGIYIVGEGITEQYYFAHIKKIFCSVNLLKNISQSILSGVIL